LAHDVRAFLKHHATSIIVYVLFLIVIAVWATGFLGQYIVPAGTVVGTLAIAVSGIASENVLNKWIVTAVGTILVGIFAWTDTESQPHTQQLKTQFESDVQQYGALPDNNLKFTVYLAGRLRQCLNTLPVPLDHCEDLESLLEHVGGSNGSVPYFRAEILRYKNRFADSDDELSKYLEADNERRPGNWPDNGLASVCDQNGTGYCRERTAWVCHTLANDFYRRACAATGAAQRQELFNRAQKEMDCVNKEYNGGFIQRLGTRPLSTVELVTALQKQMGSPISNCAVAAKL